MHSWLSLSKCYSYLFSIICFLAYRSCERLQSRNEGWNDGRPLCPSLVYVIRLRWMSPAVSFLLCGCLRLLYRFVITITPLTTYCICFHLKTGGPYWLLSKTSLLTWCRRVDPCATLLRLISYIKPRHKNGTQWHRIRNNKETTI